MAREVKFKGQVVSEDLLKQKADSIGITVDKYLEDYKCEFERSETPAVGSIIFCLEASSLFSS